MRRAERLFQIIQVLRRSPRPVTGAALAAELEVSTRTVYRDVADLMAQRVPITGEAGFGYAHLNNATLLAAVEAGAAKQTQPA